jgi:hypothetical protein
VIHPALHLDNGSQQGAKRCRQSGNHRTGNAGSPSGEENRTDCQKWQPQHHQGLDQNAVKAGVVGHIVGHHCRADCGEIGWRKQPHSRYVAQTKCNHHQVFDAPQQGWPPGKRQHGYLDRNRYQHEERLEANATGSEHGDCTCLRRRHLHPADPRSRHPDPGQRQNDHDVLALAEVVSGRNQQDGQQQHAEQVTAFCADVELAHQAEAKRDAAKRKGNDETLEHRPDWQAGSAGKRHRNG